MADASRTMTVCPMGSQSRTEKITKVSWPRSCLALSSRRCLNMPSRWCRTDSERMVVYSISGALKCSPKVATCIMLLRELIFADDCALLTNFQEDLQNVVSDFDRAAICCGLIVCIKTTELMVQQKPGTPPCDPVIKIGADSLGAVETFCYIGSILSQNARIDEEVTA